MTLSQGSRRSEVRIVAACVAGDGAAVEVLCRRYRSRLVALLVRRTGDPVLAEDLAHDTLLRAIDNLDRFDTDRPLWPWLARIASNLAIDHARHASHQVLDSDPVPETQQGAEPDQADQLSDRMQLQDALATLPPRQRAALELTYFEGWDSRDVASWLEVSPAAVKQLLFRGRRAMRATFSADTDRMGLGLVTSTATAVRDLAVRLRTRVAAWEASWHNGWQGIGAATAGIAIAATLTTTGFLPDPAPHRASGSIPTQTLAAHHTDGAPEARAPETPVGVTVSASTPALASEAAGAGPTGPQTVHRFTFTAPDDGILGDPTETDADVRKDEETRTINAWVYKQVPGTPVESIGGTFLGVQCDGSARAACDVIDAVPSEDEPRGPPQVG